MGGDGVSPVLKYEATHAFHYCGSGTFSTVGPHIMTMTGQRSEENQAPGYPVAQGKGDMACHTHMTFIGFPMGHPSLGRLASLPIK